MKTNTKNSHAQNLKMITEQLRRKYTIDFEYTRIQPINRIVFNKEGCITNIMFKEVAAWAEDCEFLKRQYNYIGKSGQDELFPRIQLLARFFSNKTTIGSFYPTMILSKTKFIFMKRFHRITKTIDPNDTSNNIESSVHSDSGILNLGITHVNASNCFLKNLNLNISYSGSSNSSMSYKNTLRLEFYDYDEKPYNIYEENSQQENEEKNKKEANKKLDNKRQSSIISINKNSEIEKDISYLVCDCEQFNIQETLKNYAKYCKLQNSVSNQQKLNNNTNENAYPFFLNRKNEQRKQKRSKQMIKSKQKKLATKICIQPLDSNNTYDTTKPSYNGNFFEVDPIFYEQNQRSDKYYRYGASQASDKFMKLKSQKSNNIYYSPRQFSNQLNNRRQLLEQREENYYPRSNQKPLVFIVDDEQQFLRRDRKKYLRDKAAELLGRKAQYDYVRLGTRSKWSNNYY